MLPLLLAASAIACRGGLPHGPAIPAPIVLSTSCGRFVIGDDGSVRRLPPRPRPVPKNVSWRLWGHPLTLRRNRAGRYFILRHGKLVWRSRALYPNDGGNIAFGPHLFAFASYRRGIFLTDLERPERLVVRGRGLYPTDFDDAGRLIVGHGKTIDLISRRGETLRRYRYRLRNGFFFDEGSDKLFFVTPGGVLARARGTKVRLGADVSHVDGTISVDSSDLLVFSGAHSITITRMDGTRVSHASWPRASRVVSDSGVSVSPNHQAFAFRLTDARPGSRSSTAAVYVVRAGANRARAVYRHHLGPSGCAVGASLAWHGRFLLYDSTDGRKAVVDTTNHRVIDLTRLARRLPHRNPAEVAGVSWLADFLTEY